MADRRTWNVGQLATFPFKVQTSSGDPVQLLPDYPKYAITSPSGLSVQEGVATPVAPAGSYEVTWTVPLQAEVSTDQATWVLTVYIVTARRNTRELKFEFDVVNRSIGAQQRRDIVETHLEGKSYRALWRGPSEPLELSLECYFTDAPDDAAKAPLAAAVDKATMQKTFDNGDTVFYYDIPAANFKNGTTSTFSNQFTVLWSSRDTAAAESAVEYQQVRVLRRSGFRVISDLRFIVDKFQHRLGSVYYMSDGDLCTALNHGLRMLNQWHPVNLTFSDNTVPESLQGFWIALSAVWMLSAQHLVAGTQAFNFSGQSISLDQDLTGPIDSAIQRLMDQVNNQLTPAKTSVFRQASRAGSIAVRPARLSSPSTRVYKVDSTVAGSGSAPPGIFGVAQMLGIFS